MPDIPIQSISVKDRARLIYGDLDTLRQSIRETGLIQPICVMETAEPNQFELLAGGRRLAAMIAEGWTMIPCRILPHMDELSKKEVELEENVQREDFSPVERANLVRAILELKTKKYGAAMPGTVGGYRLEDVANLFGMSRATVSQEIEISKAVEARPELANLPKRSDIVAAINRDRRQEQAEQASQRVMQQRLATPEDGLKRELVDNYVVGDFFNVVQNMPEGVFQCIELDPPYGIGFDKTPKTSAANVLDYEEIPSAQYPVFMRRMLEQCHRVLSPDGWLLCWFGAKTWTNTIHELLQEVGFHVPSIFCVWAKPGPGGSPNPQRILGSAWEGFYYCDKSGAARLFNPGESNVFINPSPSAKIHPTERPISLMMGILRVFCPTGGRILVPCAGSGNTLLAACNLRMHPLGVDINPAYKPEFTLRAMNQPFGNYMDHNMMSLASNIVIAEERITADDI